VQLEENKQKVFREMVIIKFDQKAKIDPGMLMKLVSRNTKKGAQFTPQGVLRWPLTSSTAADVIVETKALLEQLDLVPVAASA
jgi:transcription-repair coupling factor (superfamily II helicase)